jgi:hypothetical protein
MARIQKFPHNSLESICDVLGDTNNGLTGTEIGKYLARCRIPDGITSKKRIRLYEALSAKQASDDCWQLCNTAHPRCYGPGESH